MHSNLNANWNLSGRSVTACVIAQQYSSATVFSLPFHSRQKPSALFFPL